jgi:hypothetical protein
VFLKKKAEKIVRHLSDCINLIKMVVTRKVRGVKKDGEPTASTSTEAAMDEPKDLAAVDIENIGIDEEDIKAPDDIKEEDGEKNREKRTPKPSFKVKYASQKLAGIKN